MKKKVIKLNENDIENLVKKIIKKEKLNESIFDYDYDDDVIDIHDSLTYTSSDVTAASYYDETLKRIIDEAINDGYQPSEEMVSLTRRLDYDISALDGAHSSVTRLVDIMLDEDEYKSQL